MKNVIKITMLILGTLIGAGFASGKEIYIFFNRFGLLGIVGILISATITGIVIYTLLTIVKVNEVSNYSDMLKTINSKHDCINKIIMIIVNLFLLVSFFIMTSAFSAYLNQQFGTNKYIASMIFILFCYIVFKKDLQGVMKINTILVPLLLMFILYLGIRNIPSLSNYNMNLLINENSHGFLISSILYASYNSIILIPILIKMKDSIKTKKEIFAITLISVITIILLCFSIYSLLLKNDSLVKKLELPLVEITKSRLYSFVIIVSIFTSAISTGYSFMQNVSNNKKEYNTNLILISITSIVVSNIGFSNLVNAIYPLFGVLGFLQICFLVKFIPKLQKPLEKRKKN